MPTEIRCPGCDKPFRPRGFAQHISKSRDARCRGAGAPLAPLPAVSFPHTGSSQPSDPFLLSEALDRGRPDDNSDPQSTIGEFTMTRVAHRNFI